LNKHERDYQVETVFIKYLRKLSKVHSGIQQLEIFESLQAELKVMLEDHNERVVLEYFNVEAWVNSKIKKIPFDESVRMTVS
jgi:hypothetical protein